MIANFRMVLFVAVAVSSFPAAAAGQVETAGNVSGRIEILERRILDLENRIRELESILQPAGTQSPGVAAQSWRNIENWRRLRRGATASDIREILGEPTRVESMIGTRWYYGEGSGGGYVFFDSSGRVEGWSEPRP